MFHKGLNKEIIVESAKEMIEKDGVQQFSMRKLAEKLGGGQNSIALLTYREYGSSFYQDRSVCIE